MVERRARSTANAFRCGNGRLGLIAQQWTEDIAEKLYCLVVSVSDMFARHEPAKIQMSWDMTVKHLSETSCEISQTLKGVTLLHSRPPCKMWFVNRSPLFLYSVVENE
jgi:hypothetical protein